MQELLFARGIDVTYETIRQWCLKFGQDYANQLRRRRPQPGDTWYLDEVFLTINSKRVVYLLVADHVLRLLPIRLRRVNQPVIRSRNVVATPRSPLLA